LLRRVGGGAVPPRRDMTLNMKAPGISISGRRKKAALIPAVLALAVLTLLSGPQTAEQRVGHRSIGPGCRYTWMTDSERGAEGRRRGGTRRPYDKKFDTLAEALYIRIIEGLCVSSYYPVAGGERKHEGRVLPA